MEDDNFLPRREHDGKTNLTHTYECKFDTRGWDDDMGSKVDGYAGEVFIEYRPGDYILEEDFNTEYVIREDATPEEFIADLYNELLDILYPKERKDEPWKFVPLVVDIEYKRWDGNGLSEQPSGSMHVGAML